jgi:hypothetical protein
LEGGIPCLFSIAYDVFVFISTRSHAQLALPQAVPLLSDRVQDYATDNKTVIFCMYGGWGWERTIAPDSPPQQPRLNICPNKSSVEKDTRVAEIKTLAIKKTQIYKSQTSS